MVFAPLNNFSALSLCKINILDVFVYVRVSSFVYGIYVNMYKERFPKHSEINYY